MADGEKASKNEEDVSLSKPSKTIKCRDGNRPASAQSKGKKHVPKSGGADVDSGNAEIKATSIDHLPPEPSSETEVKTIVESTKHVKSKSELKADRRAQQEAQRAKKAAGKAPTTEKAAVRKDNLRAHDSVKHDVASTQQKVAKELAKHKLPIRPKARREVRLFSHLPQHERNDCLTKDISFSSAGIHPAIVKLGIQYSRGIYCGSNARCLALLAVFKQVISDYTTPPRKELSRDLDAKIKPYIMFLNQCRPLSVSMGNAIKYIKWHINHTPSHISDTEAKEQLIDCINRFWKEKIVLAGKAITDCIGDKIIDGDVIVVYSCSSLVVKVLLHAQQTHTFRVIIVDARPKLEGRELLRKLVKAGIECSYVLINALSYVMKEATKVLLGAHALLANGNVMSRVGSSMLALAAHSRNVPVLVCCETYKFCERVQTDSFVFNELGDPDDLVSIGNRESILGGWRSNESLSLLNLVYDVTPAELISMVITELGMIPCTSVPVVLRVGQARIPV